MPIPLLALAGISAAGSALTSWMNNSAQSSAIDKENQYAIDMWNRQNAYNTPAAQMQRYKDAGLNPNLIYGQGTPGNAAAAPAPQLQASRPKFDFSQVMTNAVQLQQQQQTIENLKTNQDLMNQSIELSKANLQDALSKISERNYLKVFKGENLASLTSTRNALMPYQSQVMLDRSEQLRAATGLSDALTDKTRALLPSELNLNSARAQAFRAQAALSLQQRLYEVERTLNQRVTNEYQHAQIGNAIDIAHARVNAIIKGTDYSRSADDLRKMQAQLIDANLSKMPLDELIKFLHAF